MKTPKPLRRHLKLTLICAAAALLAGALAPARADCNTSTSTVDLGSHTSLYLADNAVDSSGQGGLSCTGALSLLEPSYIKVRMESSSFLLSGPGGPDIPFTVAAIRNGTPLTNGTEADLSSLDVLTLFSGPDNTVPFYFSTAATPALQAGTYTSSITVRWFYSVAAIGLLGLGVYYESPGFVRPLLSLGEPTWGTGVATTIPITLVVTNDCVISAPDVDFGAAPLVGGFDPVTQSISIRCSAGATYSVGLSNGNHYADGSRRMASGSDYLRYNLFKSDRSVWGSSGSERWSSDAASVNPGLYDGSTRQQFTYSAEIDATQITPPNGTYTDSIVVDVQF